MRRTAAEAAEDDPDGEEAKWLHLAEGRLITPPRRRDSGVRSREMAPPMTALSAECLCDRKPCVYELVMHIESYSRSRDYNPRKPGEKLCTDGDGQAIETF